MAPPDGNGAPNAAEVSKTEEAGSRLTRRNLLVSSLGIASAAAIGGWLYGNRGPTGAKAVATAYIEAIAGNDWALAGDQYHEDASPIQEIEGTDGMDTYEDFLEANELLERYEALQPAIEELYVWERVGEPTEEAADTIMTLPDAAVGADEWKSIIAIVSVHAETFYRERFREGYPEFLADERTNEAVQLGTIREDETWSLWSVNL